ncbi:hypothetical protein HID58_018513 [Brassica napus]|uniref:OCRE domain-containing protein n=1 Tax=Brassica napus TaxID=3708 RepID=A0ABQ8DBA0_BRANA|nr:hypothetical protein HID58_018513 [Brassica napus]
MLDSASGYFYNQINGLHYDSKSDSFSDSIAILCTVYLCGLTWAGDATGSWVIQDDAHTAVKTSSDKGKVSLKSLTMKGAASSVDVGNNNKRDEMRNPRMYLQKRKLLEKPLLGLYNRPKPMPRKSRTHGIFHDGDVTYQHFQEAPGTAAAAVAYMFES